MPAGCMTSLAIGVQVVVAGSTVQPIGYCAE